jgi:acyl carrier protein
MHLARDLGADSLDRLELLMTLEEIFRVTIEDTSAARVETIGDVVALVKERQGLGEAVDAASTPIRNGERS